ncbi:MAG: amino acid permease, partial [Firmicutes bacterium]|nr:amino acid permease [Bacillota bacterium]
MDLRPLFRRKPPELALREAESGPRLRRTLGAPELALFGIGAIIGTGIFVLTGVGAARYAGPGIVLSFLVSGTVAALAALCYAELASMLPIAGSAYTYAYTALGEIVAWVIGWDLILEYVVAAAAVAIGWSSYLRDLLASAGLRLPAWATSPLLAAPGQARGLNLPAMAVTLAVTALLVRGTRQGERVNDLVVMIKLAVIAVFLAAGSIHARLVHWRPFLPYGLPGVFHGAAIIFFAYIGFDAVSTAAEEVREPARDLPRGILASLGVSTALYVAVSALLTLLVPYRRLDTASPVATALLDVGVRWGAAAVSVGALAGLTSVLLVNVFGQSRIFFAMARDGLLPAGFARLHPRFRTPYRVTLLTGLAVTLLAGLLPVGEVARLANIGTLAAFFLVSLGVIVLRRRHPEWRRPFRVPAVPWLPALAG